MIVDSATPDYEALPDDHKFRWDGEFVANPHVLGSWKLITEVAEIEEFDPAEKKQVRARNPLVTSITLNQGGTTGEATRVWSGDHLMDLDKYQALRLLPQKLGDAEFLFVEAGGFSTRNKPDWRPKWLVLGR